MMEPPVFDLNQIFEDVVERGRQNGVFEHEAYRDLCEEVLYEHETDEEGSLSEDQNMPMRLEALLKRFPEYLDRVK